MTAIVTRGNAADLHLPDETVDLIVTSPPYFGLRSYQDGGEHYAGQVGDEATPTEYLDALLNCTAEWMRVLKPGGSIFVNLGDKYMATSFAPQKRGKDASGVERPTITRDCERCGEEFTGGPGRRFCSSFCGGSDNSKRTARGGIQPKSLIGLPWRYAIRCIDELGLILRAEIVWAKPNGLPESVTDRVRRSHEQVFHFVKQPRYYSAVDEVREAHSPHTLRYYSDGSAAVSGRREDRQRGHGRDPETRGANFPTTSNPLGKLPGSVWTIPTAPLKVPASLGIDHFAAYPPELVRRIVLGWSPREVCVACGEGRRPVSVTDLGRKERATPAYGLDGSTRHGRDGSTLGSRGPSAVITGYACACPDTDAPATHGVVLDPFGGTGTTALVASAYGRVGISNDLSADYCRLAQWRTTDPGERARVLRVDKPPVQVDGQLGMFEGIGA